MIQISECIKREDYSKWVELFKACNGRFVCNPLDLFGSSVSVNYSFDNGDDYRKFCEGWYRLNMVIVEKKRGWLGGILKRMGLVK